MAITRSISYASRCILLSLLLLIVTGEARGSVKGWWNTYIGDTGGRAEEREGTLTISGGGWGIFSFRDNFHYVYKQLQGDGAIIVRILSYQNVGEITKAGVMIRETLAPGSKYAFVYVQPTSIFEIAFRMRLDNNCWTASAARDTASIFPDQNLSYPYWIKLERRGNWFTAYVSRDGTEWTVVPGNNNIKNPFMVNMKDSVLVGIAVTSGSLGSLCSFQFDNVQCTGNVFDRPLELKAQDPEPKDGADIIMTQTRQPLELDWSSGDTAASHDVYIGTNPALVNAEYIGRTAESNRQFVPWGGTYYWRVDEVESDGKTIHIGDIWSFTYHPVFDPAPADSMDRVDFMTQLTWSSASNTDGYSFNVYLSTDENAVNDRNLSAYKGNTTYAQFNPNPLEGDTTYYWCIDMVDIRGIHQGDIWSFRTVSAAAWDPNPIDGARVVPIIVNLNWQRGSNAISHDIYIGSDEIAVGEATRGSLEYRGSQVSNNYCLRDLELDQTYYWRIDTIRFDRTVRGEVWSFSTLSPDTTDIVIPYAIPRGSIVSNESEAFRVSVNGQPVRVEEYRWISYAHFAFAGKADIRIHLNEPIQRYTLSPKSYNIDTEVDGQDILFSITVPRKLILHKINSWDFDPVRTPRLFIFADPLESNPPEPEGDHVINALDRGIDNSGVKDETERIQTLINEASKYHQILYFSPGTYKIATLFMRDNATLYLAGGARLQGFEDIRGGRPGNGRIIFDNVRNAGLTGRGSVDGQGVFLRYHHPEKRSYSIVTGEGAEDCVLEDVIIRDSGMFTVWIMNSEGWMINNVKIVDYANVDLGPGGGD